ncbi:uncharacterized protein FOMMEDRAFT_96086 [Fomitiporia mediterranea MF3/22]|uniref:uncharacterized protein n=1 Tax=Fomitiporia mediterranea (strain MF3/22) TaxID=694068 RepID=UPI0004409498|nr:uncharacterized protein FOMMEDRAFT_96086 [Fomitiporia mediterranea MF3/22]EJC98803.1 hypothetical protein FOMMEDRAFT_96086 [Fomitiporia mediterranea MF3/22]
MYPTSGSRSDNISRGEENGAGSISDDHAVHYRVRRATLSESPTAVSPDSDEASSHSTAEYVGVHCSAPQSPASESVTSFDFERGSASEHNSSPSPQPSLYSLTDSIKERSIRWEHGRPINAHCELYKFPVDEEEVHRLDKLHRLLKALAGEYVPPFYEALADNHDLSNPKTCLDLGCGSGTWLVSIATAFPHVYCTGVDLVPLPRPRIPSNLRFEVDDINLGLEHFANQFDVVNVRFISPGIKDYYRLINDAALALRTRGLADFTEFDWRMARSGTSPARHILRTTVNSVPTPFCARFFALARLAAVKRGAHGDAAPLLHLWMTEHRSFEDVVYRELFIPCGDWLRNEDARRHPTFSNTSADEFEKLRWAGKEGGESYLMFMSAARPLILSTGVPEELVNSIMAQASQEIHEARTPLFLCIHTVYARKKERRH